MAASTPIQKLNNRSFNGGAQPIPKFKIPPLPPKIAKIDAEGSAKFLAALQGIFDDHIEKMNVLLGNVAGQIKT